MKNKKITREDFSIEKVGDQYVAYAHFAPFYFGDTQQGKHKFIKAHSKDKEEAVDILIRALIKDLQDIQKSV